ncbi:MAG: ZIP family metal transporter [Pseudomonadota bacterium]
MTYLFHVKMISCLLILITAFVAGLYPFIKRIRTRSKQDFPIGESLAAGVFLGAGLMHMLGDASQSFDSHGFDYPMPFLLAGATFLLLLFMEHVGREIYEHRSETSIAFAVLAVIMLSIHSFLAGAALGLSSTLSVVIVILLAIMAHKWAASFALAVQLNKSALNIGLSVILFSLFTITTPLGILFGNIVMHHFTHYPMLAPIFKALAAGTFLYLGTLHGLKQSVMVDKCCDLKRFYFVIAGFVIMAIVAIWT